MNDSRNLGVTVVPAEPLLRWIGWPTWKSSFAETFHGRFVFWVIAIGLLLPAVLVFVTSLPATHWWDAFTAAADAFWAVVLLLLNRIGAEQSQIIDDLLAPSRKQL